jgi:TetR/AcrR family transcriptional regulator, mexJK operon transcriptional repressor
MTSTQVAGEESVGRRLRPDKREAILRAAGEIFDVEGYERTSIDAVAARSGVSKPTIYNHFGSKEQLFRDHVAYTAQVLNVRITEAVHEIDPGCREWRQVLSKAALQLAECQRSPCSISLTRQLHAAVGRDPSVYRYVADNAAGPVLVLLSGKLAQLDEAGHLSVPDPALAARQFLALISAELPEMSRLGSVPINDDDFSRAVMAGLETFLRAFAR